MIRYAAYIRTSTAKQVIDIRSQHGATREWYAERDVGYRSSDSAGTNGYEMVDRYQTTVHTPSYPFRSVLTH